MLTRAKKGKMCNILEVMCAAPPMGSIEGVTHLPHESCLHYKIPQVVCVTPFIGSKIIELSYYIKCAMEWRFVCVTPFIVCKEIEFGSKLFKPNFDLL